MATKAKTKRPEYVSVSGLVGKRGWTKTMVDKFAGPPDKLADNPHYKCAAPMRLYDLKRIKRIEKGKRWNLARQAGERRKMATGVSADMRQERLAEWAEKVTIEVRRLVPPELERRGREYADTQAAEWGREPEGELEEEGRLELEFLGRQADALRTPEQRRQDDALALADGCIGYLLKVDTPYRVLPGRSRRVRHEILGFAAGDVLLRRMLVAIGEQYPALTSQCEWLLREQASHKPEGETMAFAAAADTLAAKTATRAATVGGTKGGR